MSPVGLGAIVLLLAAAVLHWYRRGSRYYLVGAVAVVAITVAAVAVGRLAIGAPSLVDVALIVSALLMLAEAIGLPPAWSRRLGVGWRSREFEFDRRLQRLADEFNRLIERPENRRAGGAELSREGRAIAARMARLESGNAAWSQLARDYAAYVEVCITAVEEGSMARDALVARAASLQERRDALRRGYTAEADRLLEGR